MSELQLLSPSRRKRSPGDVFVYQARPGEFGFGRLISTDAKIGGFEGVHLIYVYRAFSSSKGEIPVLDLNDLLLAPLGTNQKPWTLGYFEVVARCPLSDAEVLPVHCFRDSRGWFFNEKGERLPSRSEPCGDYGLHSYRTIGEAIFKALESTLLPNGS